MSTTRYVVSYVFVVVLALMFAITAFTLMTNRPNHADAMMLGIGAAPISYSDVASDVVRGKNHSIIPYKRNEINHECASEILLIVETFAETNNVTVTSFNMIKYSLTYGICVHHTPKEEHR